MDLFLNFWNILKNSLIYFFVRYLSYSLLKIHRKLTSGYLLCDKATYLTIDNQSLTQIRQFFSHFPVYIHMSGSVSPQVQEKGKLTRAENVQALKQASFIRVRISNRSEKLERV